MPTEVILDHLGGYLSGPVGDEATYFPDMWRWLAQELNVRSVLDIGCGEGHSLKFFQTLGIPATGIEGIPQDDPNIIQHDYTLGPFVPERPVFTLGWCCEVLEHIEERFLPNLVPTFNACNYLAVTHAFPGQQGHHHVNCQTRDYWLGFFAAIGFEYMPDLTYESKRKAALNTSPWNHWTRSGLLLRRR